MRAIIAHPSTRRQQNRRAAVGPHSIAGAQVVDIRRPRTADTVAGADRRRPEEKT